MPSFGPLNVIANATSSTTIVVKWGDVPKEHQNGLIEGYKVFYAAETKSPAQYKQIPSNSTFTTTLTELKKFVTYHIQVLAYTRLGDGEASKPAVSVRTFEDGKLKQAALMLMNIFMSLYNTDETEYNDIVYKVPAKYKLLNKLNRL